MNFLKNLSYTLTFSICIIVSLLNLIPAKTCAQATIFDGSQYVNQVTGQFNYGVPLMELPVPGGRSFPVSLSYASGITPDMEPSWVGLGWNLEVGSISRSTLGVPDDWDQKEVTNLVIRKSGNTYVVSTVGEKDHSSYMAFNYISGYKKDWVNIGFGWRQEFSPIYKEASVVKRYFEGTHKNTLYGTLHRNKFYIDYPIINNFYPTNIAQDVIEDHGVGYYNSDTIFIGVPNFHGPAYDSYQVQTPYLSGTIRPYHLDIHPNGLIGSSNKLINSQTPLNCTGPTIPTYGVPVYGQTVGPGMISEGYRSKYKTTPTNTNNSPRFMFLGDGSGYFRSMPGYMYFTPSNTPRELATGHGLDHLHSQLSFSRSGSSIIDQKGNSSTVNYASGRLVQKNYIEWASNAEMHEIGGINNTNPKKMIECPEMFQQRMSENALVNTTIPQAQKESRTDPKGIGAFKVVDENGFTYHFSLPVHEYENVSVAERNIGLNLSDNSYLINSSLNYNKTAVSWHLTAITGPDFIDNGNHMIDDTDQGYWIKFNYGLWSNGFIWRSPRQGFNESKPDPLNNRITNFQSFGRRQLYYLNSIESKTHIMLFIKDIRFDFPSIKEVVFPAAFPTFDNVCYNHGADRHGQLKLSRIVVLPKDKYTALNVNITNASGSLATPTQKTGKAIVVDAAGVMSNRTFQYAFNFQQNVLDVKDVEPIEQVLNQHSIYSVDLETDYHLRSQSKFGNVNHYALNTNWGSLTLKATQFNSFANTKVKKLSFNYANNPSLATSDVENDWGFLEGNQAAWSMTRIAEEEGTALNIVFENNTYSLTALPNFIKSQTSMMGGNVRVCTLLFEGANTYRTSFNYNSPGTNVSSGMTFYRPNEDRHISFGFMVPQPQVYYRSVAVQHFDAIGALTGTVRNQYQVPEFEYSYNYGLASQHRNAQITIRNLFYMNQNFNERNLGNAQNYLRISTTVIHNKLFALGLPVQSQVFDANHKLISAKKWIYNESTADQVPTGLYQESFFNSKYTNRYREGPCLSFNPGNSQELNLIAESHNLSTIIHYSPILDQLEEYDYQTGNKKVTSFSNYDITTGKPLTVSSIVNGQPEQSQTQTLSHQRYPSLSSKVWDVNNTNQLSIPVGAETFIGGRQRSSSANAVKFGYYTRELTGQGYYAWQYMNNPTALSSDSYLLHVTTDPNGFLPPGLPNFNYAQPNANGAHWKLGSRTLRVNRSSQPLETEDAKGVIASYRYHPVWKVPASTAVNANVASAVHDGFEQFDVEDVQKPSNSQIRYDEQIAGVSPHTGKTYLSVQGGASFTLYKQKYYTDGSGISRGVWMEASIWVHQNSATFTLQLALSGTKEGCTAQPCTIVEQSQATSGAAPAIPGSAWKRVKAAIFVPADYISDPSNTTQHLEVQVIPTGGGTLYLDDFMLRPATASFAATVFDEHQRVQYELDKDNFYTQYFYDNRSRVIKTVRETEKGVFTVAEQGYND